jgi:PAS domain-containing protein/DNA-binding CsgD family transcriptional regulator
MEISLQEELTDAVFRAALEPDAWGDVIHLMKRRFPSAAQTFYFLDLKPRRVRPVFLKGIEPRWIDSFDALYFAADNPWMRLTQQLHRPGVVRTNERLDRLLHDPGVLYRSSYYNDWMRPQGFKYTIGNTLLADENSVANVTLMRSPDMATFDEREVRAFEGLSRQLTRALQISVRLERAETEIGSAHAFDGLPQGIALVDAQGKIRYANPAMEAILRARRGLAVRQGVIEASLPEARMRFIACMATAFAAVANGSCDGAPLILKYDDRAHLAVQAMPVTGTMARYLPSTSLVLLMATQSCTERLASCDELRSAFGYTKSEARLAQLLVQGNDLQHSAKAMGITYGTARVYLKAVFEKAGVHSQSQLVARTLREAVFKDGLP